jgi:hypothetical protein
MGLTLNQVLKRIQSLTLAHKQVRTFKQGLVTDFFTDKTTKYPAACLQDNGGAISISGHSTTLSYRMFLLDLAHVSEDSKQNEQDVQSDMVLIAQDLLAQMSHPAFDDWVISADNQLQLLVEQDNDLIAGCYFDFSVRIMYEQNVCQVPSDIIDYTPTDDSMKYIYDLKYTATGTEGTTLTIPELAGKKILFMTRANAIIYKTSSAPASSEFTWDDTTIGLGAVTNPNEPFLFLFRNY